MRRPKIPLRGHHLELFSHALPPPPFSFKWWNEKGFAHFFQKKSQLKNTLPRGYTPEQTKAIVDLIHSLIRDPNQKVIIVDNYDYICEFCPPYSEEHEKCKKNPLQKYDRFIAHMWGLKIGKEYPFKKIIKRYYKPVTYLNFFRHNFLTKVEYPIKEFVKGHLSN